jgi:hypothetical protein
MSALLSFTASGSEQTIGLQLVPPAEVPEAGTFWILSWEESPPIPFNPFLGCNVYSVGDEQFVVDDSELAVTRAAMAEAQAAPPPPTGCGNCR